MPRIAKELPEGSEKKKVTLYLSPSVYNGVVRASEHDRRPFGSQAEVLLEEALEARKKP